jgi:hypothetical protein
MARLRKRGWIFYLSCYIGGEEIRTSLDMRSEVGAGDGEPSANASLMLRRGTNRAVLNERGLVKFDARITASGIGLGRDDQQNAK